ncbi:SUR7 family protein pun1 [Candida viswanathii]|uniref:SUR7 family protein pun1 n=1 Tax=Candida viswanathii TaxID=5486 RepID=A0A367XZ42_9ASCO|nr:SUR7 family protein pun1 [Candida viswanathii]
MIFKVFRVILIILSLIVAILEIFAITGSYQNENYLTDTYLINFHLDNLNLGALIDYSQISKRQAIEDQSVQPQVNYFDTAKKRAPRVPSKREAQESGWYYVPGTQNTQSAGESGAGTTAAGMATTTVSGGSSSTAAMSAEDSTSIGRWWSQASGSAVSDAASSAAAGASTRGSATATIATGSTSGGASPATNVHNTVETSLASQATDGSDTSGGYYTTVAEAVRDLLNNVSPQQLGMAQVYSVGYWGYCRGYVESSGDNNKTFDNSHVVYTWCSKAKANFFFNPVTIFKDEMNNTVNGVGIDGQSTYITELTYTQRSQLQVLIENLNEDDVNLPGNLDKNLQTLHNLTSASFGLLFSVAILSFVSVIIQFFAFCFSPEKCCLSFLNFLFQAAISLLAIVGAGIATGTYQYVRSQVNDNTDTYGIKSFLSTNFNAFIWSAAVASMLVVFFNLLGHCCGLFGHRKHYRTIRHEEEHHHHDHHHDKEFTDSD